MNEPGTVCLLTDEAIHAVRCQVRGSQLEIHARSQEAFTVPTSLLVEHDPNELADAVARAIQDAGLPSGSIMLVIPVQWSFVHVLEAPSRRMTDQALAYEFEQFLPLPLEEVTWAFTRLGGRRVLGAAIPTEPMSQLLAALGQRGIEVDHIVVDVTALAAEAEDDDLPPANVAIIDRRWIRVTANHGNGDDWVIAAFEASPDSLPLDVVTEQLRQRRVHAGRTPTRWLRRGWRSRTAFRLTASARRRGARSCRAGRCT